jgi:hypothetical protein
VQRGVEAEVAPARFAIVEAVFDHVTIRASDREASERFYATVLATLGVKPGLSDEWVALGVLVPWRRAAQAASAVTATPESSRLRGSRMKKVVPSPFWLSKLSDPP